MIPTRVILVPLSACLFPVLLCGCGISTQSTTTSTNTATTTSPNASVLAGNWLLAGAMPPGYNVVSSALSVTATFDVNGSAVSGAVQVGVPCLTIGASGSALAVQGNVAADGSFTLNSVTTAGVTQTLTIQGNVPSVAGGPWSGSFSFTNTGPSCSGTTSGAVVATAIPSVTGTYSGAIAVGSGLNGINQAVGLKMALQQGGSLAASGPYTNLSLTGTLTVTNSTCLTSGTTTGASQPGFVAGAVVGAVFNMNDGSTGDDWGYHFAEWFSHLGPDLHIEPRDLWSVVQYLSHGYAHALNPVGA